MTDAGNLEENPIRKKVKAMHVGKTQKLRSTTWTLFEAISVTEDKKKCAKCKQYGII